MTDGFVNNPKTLGVDITMSLRTTSIRINTELLHDIKSCASDNGRTLPQEIISRLKRSLKTPGSWSPATQKRQNKATQTYSLRCPQNLYDDLHAAASLNSWSLTKELTGRLEYSLSSVINMLPPVQLQHICSSEVTSSKNKSIFGGIKPLTSGPFILVIGMSGSGKSVLVSDLVLSAVAEGNRVRVITETSIASDDTASIKLREIHTANPNLVTINACDSIPSSIDTDELIFIDCPIQSHKVIDEHKHGQQYPVCISLQTLEDIDSSIATSLIMNTRHLVFCGPMNNNARHWPDSMPIDAPVIISAGIQQMGKIHSNGVSESRYQSITISNGDLYQQKYEVNRFESIRPS